MAGKDYPSGNGKKKLEILPRYIIENRAGVNKNNQAKRKSLLKNSIFQGYNEVSTKG